MSDTITHPARFSDDILTVLARHLEPGWKVLDPMAGVGRVHELRGIAQVRTWGIELEAEWAAQHPRTVCYDARQATDLFDVLFDALATSPAYGNRMADLYDGRDGSRRHTYRLDLGRPLSEGSGAALQWGPAYRQLHTEIWAGTVPLVRPGGRVILNCKNHIRGGVEQRVTEWHIDHLMSVHGLRLVAIDLVPSAGLPDGANASARTFGEFVVVLERPEPTLFDGVFA